VHLGTSDQMLMELYKEHSIKFNLIGVIVGAIFTVLSILGVFLADIDFVKDNGALTGFFDFVGNFIYWLFIIALGVLIISAWLFSDLILKLKKFNQLIDTNSKAVFVRHQNEIEELAWKLGNKYLEIVVERKKELKIRKR
jgi:hypothetical protein